MIMNYKKLLFGVLLMAVIFLVACAPAGVINQTTDSCTSLDSTARDDCYAEAKKCSQIHDVKVRDTCVVELAKIKNDLSVCNLIVSDKTKAYCQEELATLQNDHSLCTKITDTYWEDNCHFNLAVNNSKEVYCSLIGNTEQKEDCFTQIALDTNNALLCEFLPQEKNERCIFTIAKNLGKIEICNALSGSVSRDALHISI